MRHSPSEPRSPNVSTNHGRLTLEETESRQADPEAAAKRFEKFDVNKDGIVTREEYIGNGAKKLKAK